MRVDESAVCVHVFRNAFFIAIIFVVASILSFKMKIKLTEIKLISL